MPRCSYHHNAFKVSYGYLHDGTDQCWITDIGNFGDEDDTTSYCIFHAPVKKEPIDRRDWPIERRGDMQAEQLKTFLEQWNANNEEVNKDKTLNFVLPGLQCGYINLCEFTFSASVRFHSATFSKDAWFDATTFSGYADFTSATFSGIARFESATFSEVARFNSATFSEGAGFKSTTFSRFLEFNYVTLLKSARFQDAIFSGGAWFKSTTFPEHTGFYGTTFSGVASFYGTTFSGDAAFFGSTFSEIVRFDSTTFSGRAEFNNITFSKDAWFDATTFSGDTWFDDTIFSGDAGFESAIFSGIARFESATFSEVARFNSAQFKVANFDSAQFKFADFTNAKFESTTNFSKVTFEKAPIFHNAELHQSTDFREVVFDDKQSRHAPPAYRTLKIAMGDVRSKEEEALFYAYELESNRKQHDTHFSVKLFTYLYYVLSDYGRSFMKPLGWLLFFSIAFSVMYFSLLVTYNSSLELWPYFFQFTVEQIVKPFSIWSNKGSEVIREYVPNQLLLFQLLATVQSIMSIALITLFVLAVRRKFKLG